MTGMQLFIGLWLQFLKCAYVKSGDQEEGSVAELFLLDVKSRHVIGVALVIVV